MISVVMNRDPNQSSSCPLSSATWPTLGGWITDNYSWRWIFYINVLSYRGGLASLNAHLGLGKGTPDGRTRTIASGQRRPSSKWICASNPQDGLGEAEAAHHGQMPVCESP
jgi:MFS family permease